MIVRVESIPIDTTCSRKVAHVWAVPGLRDDRRLAGLPAGSSFLAEYKGSYVNSDEEDTARNDCRQYDDRSLTRGGRSMRALRLGR